MPTSAHMDPKLATELSRTDPNVAFRADFNHVHHTWARTFYSRPELYIQPQSLEEIQKVVTLARRCRRRIVVVGSGHSPSDLTCSSSWMVNLDSYSAVLGVNREKKIMKVQAGIRLRQLNEKAAEYGLTLPSLGSINDQSFAGAIATGTHGSSLFHGPLASNVRSLRIVLGNGSCVQCSESRNPDLFRAALVSLGALGIIVEIEYQMVEERNIEWVQTIMPLDDMLAAWNKDLWTNSEFTRVWWLPYTRQVILWRANATSKPLRLPKGSWFDGQLGYYIYKSLLWLAHYFPSLLPRIELFVSSVQYGFSNNNNNTGSNNKSRQMSAVQPQRQGLLMNCLYSQFVNEWALPLSHGPEAISRLDAWFHRSPTSSLPLPADPLYVHAPIEVRVANISGSTNSAGGGGGSISSSQQQQRGSRGFLEPCQQDTPTLYLNATLYRPFGLDPPCRPEYYATFEKLMRSLNGRPHWAKNFTTVTPTDLEAMYGADLQQWRRVRREVDPDGLFVGDWHRRTVLGSNGEHHDGDEDNDYGEDRIMGCEERCVETRVLRDGGLEWIGGPAVGRGGPGSVGSSEESFDVFASAEAEASMLVDGDEDGAGVEYGKR
jgi:D-arabinono-1,4-lactone oxidase